MEGEQKEKSQQALREERILAFWKERNIFAKSLEKEAPHGDFVFYEGPPTANAKPALHHLEARAFKDVLPRYKTMQGYRVMRRAGWDTHGLPVELQIEKKLGLQSKKDIETYGIAQFNKECKDSVFTYIKDWESFTDRIGYWVDKEHAYYTFNNDYIESLWNILGAVEKRGLLYKDYKVVPWCTRCGTTLASHELAQGYQDDKDLSVYVKFPVVGQEKTFYLVWTTTPWTLPGNQAIALNKAKVSYVKVRLNDEYYILAKDKVSILGEAAVVEKELSPDELGSPYVAPYNFFEEKNIDISHTAQHADFVTAVDGTGIVHIAPMYGQDDFTLGTEIGLPKFHTVDEAGNFIKGTDFLEGRFVKDEAVAIDIIKDLAHRGLLFKKEKYEHSYPHCWRCKTPLIYYARDSWYIEMSKLRQELLDANNTINWEPSHIKEGRFGEWLREVKDWAISRERYWGTPLPIWTAEDGEKVVIDSIHTLKRYTKKSGNNYFVMRHGQTENNVKQIWSCDSDTPDILTDNGIAQVKASATLLAGEKIDLIISSPFSRTKETAELVAETIGYPVASIVIDNRLREWNVGTEYNGKPIEEYFEVRNTAPVDRYHFKTADGESYTDVMQRAAEFIYDIESQYQGKNILIVSHGGPSRGIELAANGFTYDTLFARTRSYKNFDNAEVRKIDFAPLPHNERFELDLHRPYIDQIELEKDGKPLTRVKEVMDVWFDSGSMPFAQSHYMGSGELAYPADFISEAIDQTRGWFYTLLAVGVLTDRGTPYKNVICLGHLLDKDGKKMSKSIGNIVEPFEQMDKFGVDAVRFWMYSVNQPGESKNYDEKSVAEINNKVFNLLGNVLSFYELYRDNALETEHVESTHVLDQWIMTRLNQTIENVTKGLDSYDVFTPTRTLREFIDDLSTWYLRRSRDRLKDGDADAKRTLYVVLKTTAQLMAPFAPFFSEHLWQILKTEQDTESVHLSTWPKGKEMDAPQADVIHYMKDVRYICTLGNAERKKVNIPIRQPLNSILINDTDLHIKDDSYIELIKEELNIKRVLFGTPVGNIKNVTLDNDITPELKLEGEYRELVRMIQDLRKEKGLAPQDIISLTLPEQYKEIVETFGEELKKIVGAKDLEIKGGDILIK